MLLRFCLFDCKEVAGCGIGARSRERRRPILRVSAILGEGSGQDMMTERRTLEADETLWLVDRDKDESLLKDVVKKRLAEDLGASDRVGGGGREVVTEEAFLKNKLSEDGFRLALSLESTDVFRCKGGA